MSNNEVVSDLTLMSNLSLSDWQQLNSDKDPGPPVCEPPFCDTGGNIDTGSLPENDIYFFHPDHLGSTSYITNISGETVQFNSYLPFGESFVSQKRTSTISNYLFNGKEVDSETGLYYYGARYYNSYVSTWLSVDPIALYDPIDEVEHYLDGQHNGGYYNPRNTSVYGYTYQNPIRYIDPNGKQSDAVGFVVNSLFIAARPVEAAYIIADNNCGWGFCESWVDSNYIGASSSTLKARDQRYKLGVEPVNEADLGAWDHDVRYDKLGVKGPGGVGSMKTLDADRKLRDDSKSIMDRYLSGKDNIDKVTGKPITRGTYEQARAVYETFSLVVGIKEAAQKIDEKIEQVDIKLEEIFLKAVENITENAPIK